MTERHLLKRQLQSFLRERQAIRGALLDENFVWPPGLHEVAQTQSFTGFKWSCVCSRPGTRFFGIRRLYEEPSFSFMRLAVDGFQVNAIHHITYACGKDSMSRYLIVELVSADEVIVWDCADPLPREWYLLDEFVLRRYKESPSNAASTAPHPASSHPLPPGPYGVDLMMGRQVSS